MINPAEVCLFIPAGLKKFKLALFERIGKKIERAGGIVALGDREILKALPDHIIPVVGCSPELTGLIATWREQKRNWIYWDRGYARRVFATWLPRGEDGGYYRWHLNCFQQQTIRELPNDRWVSMWTPVLPWQHNPQGHVVVACPTPTYEKFHGIQGWTETTLRRLARITDRQIVTRDKESKRSLQSDLEGANCLVAHGSMAAVEAVICGCPVVVDPSSAAALVGITDIHMINKIKFPDRTMWLNNLAYSQFNEGELVDGTLWKLLE